MPNVVSMDRNREDYDYGMYDDILVRAGPALDQETIEDHMDASEEAYA